LAAVQVQPLAAWIKESKPEHRAWFDLKRKKDTARPLALRSGPSALPKIFIYQESTHECVRRARLSGQLVIDF
jgi:hypothetical protein